MPRLSRTALLRLGAALPLLAALSPAGATNGYFSHGYGVKAQGQAGVGIAWPQDALASATNPAGTALVGERADVGLTWFAPRRSADIVGNAFGPDARYDGNGKKNFFLPELGYARPLGSGLAAGLAVYANGGDNTEYAVNPYGRFGGTGTAGVNLEQLFISPSVAWQPTEDHSFGLALNIAYQRFSAQGLGVFGGFSSSPDQVSDRGTDTSTGAGLRLGWIGTLAPGLRFGATWASKVRGKFSDYRGLFPDGGRFDVPENYGLGLAWTPAPAWTLGFDVQRILYSKVNAVGDPVDRLLQGIPLGAANGPGFGWRDMTVYKLGTGYALNSQWTLRAGYSHARQPIPANQTFLNILAPGVVQDHYTAGFTWTQGAGELSGFFAYAPNKTVQGSQSIPPGLPPGGFGGGNANVRLKETILGVAYGWKF